MKVRSMSKVSMFLVLFFIFSNIIPPINIVGVPITLQICLVMMLPFFLDIKEIGIWFLTLCMATIAGIPMMSGFSSGISVFVGPTSGYIYGWLLMMYFIKIFANSHSVLNITTVLIIAILIDYVCGAAFYTLNVSGNFLDNLIMLSSTFILFDFIKAFIVVYVVKKVPKEILAHNNK
ncbi:biotin transporter BioY [Mycoplasma sp. P36-A1]|uniref:biotin transporter BioY n=1 Tax=Mycoplasma sp. P36-A1 TaxID=3252900 RepID=UPI003C2C805D